MEPVDALDMSTRVDSNENISIPGTTKIRVCKPAPGRRNAIDSSIYNNSRIYYRPGQKYPQIDRKNMETQTDNKTKKSLSDTPRRPTYPLYTTKNKKFGLIKYLKLNSVKGRTLSKNPTEGTFKEVKKQDTSSRFDDDVPFIMDEKLMDIDYESGWIRFIIPEVPKASPYWRTAPGRRRKIISTPLTRQKAMARRYKGMLEQLSTTIRGPPQVFACDTPTQTYSNECDEYPKSYVKYASSKQTKKVTVCKSLKKTGTSKKNKSPTLVMHSKSKTPKIIFGLVSTGKNLEKKHIVSSRYAAKK